MVNNFTKTFSMLEDEGWRPEGEGWIHFLDISGNSEHLILDLVPHRCERKKGEGAIFMPSGGSIVRRLGSEDPHLCERK
jgi:hypothetical protein